MPWPSLSTQRSNAERRCRRRHAAAWVLRDMLGMTGTKFGSHYHFAETNSALAFDRQAALGYRLDSPAKE
jgi:urease beta subunit